MFLTFMVGNAAMMLRLACVVLVRRRVARLEGQLESLSRRAHEFVEARI